MPPTDRPRIARAALLASTLVALLGTSLLSPAAPSSAQPLAPVEVATSPVTLSAVGLTYTDSRHRRTSYSARSTVRISKARYTGYLSFPGVDLQPGEIITGATLTLKATQAKGASRGGIVVAPVAGNWSAAKLTARTAPPVLAGPLNRPVRARKGHTVTIRFTAADANSYLAGGSALRVRYSTSRADVRIAKRGKAAPRLRITIAPAVGAPFSFAVMPDTQQETTLASNPKFGNRTQWLVDHRTELNLKYVLHVGDVVNWGWLVPSQYGVATAAIQRLATAGIPYALTIGNHDTAAVGWNGKAGSSGYGGSAYAYNPECKTRLSVAECRTRLLVRKTATFNKAFPLAGIRNVGGAFEAGKVDNIWTTFEASGTKWLVLTLELWPRANVVAWAAGVAASHPGHNVIVQTHSFLTGSGAIDQTKGGYGSTTSQYLYDQLIKKYPNVKMVFSGHTGTAIKRVDTGVHGNRIVSYLQTFHSNSTNPVRIVTVDPASGQVTTRIVAPYTSETWTQYSTSDKLTLIR
ncbi:MAG: metallophosphoesterase [Propionicimonas sp.]